MKERITVGQLIEVLEAAAKRQPGYADWQDVPVVIECDDTQYEFVVADIDDGTLTIYAEVI